MSNPNILSERYATHKMNEIFSAEGNVRRERGLWIAVMKAQKDLGINIPSGDIEKYEKAIDDIDLKRIEEIEFETRHDVKARIQSYVETAGAGEYIHMGMTSKDLTDNIDMAKNKDASEIIRGKYIAILSNFLGKSEEYNDIILAARTHHQPAQLTLLGKRFSMWAEELYEHLNDFDDFVNTYPLRGMKGAVGTQSDMIKLLGSKEKAEELDKRIAKELGFANIMESVPQVYPRSLDKKMIAYLSLMGDACRNFAIGIRLMSGYDLVTEGFKEGQVGSSAMPHKMNTRSSERIYGFANLLKMYDDGASRISGDVWEEGDVSDSVVRRVIIPDAFYVSDGLCETTLTVLN
ncbi:adenylosuccinate lyase, partial [Patescibacteria group bacterium]|nr:adenylosuccinate lyase [Patescibacteria group bacterium]